MTTESGTTSTSGMNSATVYLVGAGPGDPGLVTLRAVECLGRADLVLCDYLVNPAVLEHAAPTAERISLGHHSTGRALSPDEITARMVEGAQSGKTVVRLKGGDPSVFGRGADEIGALREAGIPFEIVPGITVGLAVAAYCEIPITHHDDASAVGLIVGQERHCKEESCLDYGVLAGFPGTLIFYMGVRSVTRWSQGLIEHGKPPDTPVAMVRMCTWPRQRTLRCTLDTVTEMVAREQLRPPAVFVVGNVVDRAPRQSWFDARPLCGTRVLVAASPSVSEKLRRRLTEHGADVLARPAIRIEEPPDWVPVDDALARLDQYDWLVFSSANGVDSLLGRLFSQGGDARRLGRAKLAAIGPGTADRLGAYHLQTDLIPKKFRAESLAQALEPEAKGRRFLLVRASRGREVLADTLRAAGARVDQVVTYASVDVEEPHPEAVAALASGEIDWVTVTSSATAQSLVRLYGDTLNGARLASISPVTSSALRDLGYEPAVEAVRHTVDGLVDAIVCR